MLLARLLEPEAWGIVGLALVFVSAGTVLVAEGGWVPALVRAPALSTAILDTAFWSAVSAAVLLTVLLVVSANGISRFFGQAELEPILCGLAIAIPFEALGVVPRALLLRRFAFAALAARSIIGIAAGALCGAVLAVSGFGIWSLVAYQLAQPMAEACVLWRAVGWRPGCTASLAALRTLAGFLGQLAAEQLCYLIDSQMPRLLVGQALGPTAVGAYTFARRITELGTELVAIPVNRVTLPSFADAIEDLPRLRAMLAFSLEGFASISIPAFAGLALLAPELVPLLFGDHWSPAVPAVQLAALLGPAVGVGAASFVHCCWCEVNADCAVSGAPGTALMVIVLALLPNTTVNTVLVAVVARTYLMLPIRLVSVARIVSVPVTCLARSILKPIGSALGMALVLEWCRSWLLVGLPALTWLPLAVALGVSTYLALLALSQRELFLRLMSQVRSHAP